MVVPGTLNLSLERGIEFSPIILQCKDQNVSVTGTLNPNVVGEYTPCGSYSNHDLFVLEGSPSTFLYYNPVAASYVIARLLTDAALTDYWGPAAPITTDPSGTYLPNGANTGTATVTDHPVDLTGYTVDAQVRRTNMPVSGPILDLLPTVTDAVNGEVTIPAILSATTRAIEWYGNFNWDLVFTNGAGERFGPFVKGSFTISDTITQE